MYNIIDERQKFLTGVAKWRKKNDKIVPLKWQGLLPVVGPPLGLIIHRTGNANGLGQATVNFFYNHASAVSHDVIERDNVYVCVDPTRVAWHVNGPIEREKARELGLPLTSSAFGNGRWQRADMNVIGIETCEEWVKGEPSDWITKDGRLGWHKETYDTLIHRAADHIKKYNIPRSRVYPHSLFDPVDRPADPDGIVDFEELLDDIFAIVGGKAEEEVLDDNTMSRIAKLEAEVRALKTHTHPAANL